MKRGALRSLYSLVIINTVCFCLHAEEGEEVFYDKNYLPNIRTVQLYIEPIYLSDPVIPLYGPSQLHLAFDDLEGGKKNFYYTLIQCNYDWTRSELSSFDYIDGFSEQEIRDYEFSFTTYQTFTHYSLLFPNQDMKITKSGNYIIKVYEDNDPERVVLTRRFMVFEPVVEILAEVSRTEDVRYEQTHHQVHFTVRHPGFPISNAFTEVNVLVMQNFRWDNAITDVQPQFVRPGQLDYYYSLKTAFPAGKEFRYFDARTTRYRGDRIRVLEELKDGFVLTVYPDEIRNEMPYLYRKDLNGKFIPGTLDYFEQEAQSDYVKVKFTLPVDYPIGGGKIFLMGKFTDWQLRPDFEMKFNSVASVYEANVYIKQGYYDYSYKFISAQPERGDENLIEGDDPDTENTYQVFVYYRLFGSRYDRIIAYKATDTFNRSR